MFGKDKQSAGPDAQPVSGEKINKKDLPLLNDLQAAMQHEKHRGMFWTISLLAVFLLVFLISLFFDVSPVVFVIFCGFAGVLLTRMGVRGK